MHGHLAKVPAERLFNWGAQATPGGRTIYPVPKESIFHRSINQRDNIGLDADFGRQRPREAAAAKARNRSWDPAATFNSSSSQNSTLRRHQRSKEADSPPQARSGCRFVGYARWSMEGRQCTSGEMDRLMMQVAQAKFPCSRPATFEEYELGLIAALPRTNGSGADVTFVGPGSSVGGARNVGACHDTLGVRKKAVMVGDALDGLTTPQGVLAGEKSVVCVVPTARFMRQTYLATHSCLRDILDREGRNTLHRSRSWAGRGEGGKRKVPMNDQGPLSMSEFMRQAASGSPQRTGMSE